MKKSNVIIVAIISLTMIFSTCIAAFADTIELNGEDPFVDEIETGITDETYDLELVDDCDYEEDEEVPEDYIELGDDNGWELTSEQAALMEQFIEEYESQLEYSEDGIDTSDVDMEGLESQYGEEVVEMMNNGIELINEAVEDDEYVVTDNGTIYETDDEDMYVQGKYNVNKGTTYAWGRMIFQSYSNANKHKSSLKSCSKAAGLLGDVCTLAGGTGSASIFLEGIAALAIRSYANKFANSIANYNKKNYGIKYKIYWSLNYTMRTQNKSW